MEASDINFTSISTLDFERQETLKSACRQFADDLDTVESKTLKTAMLLGSRPEWAGTQSAWTAVSKLHEVVEPLVEESTLTNERLIELTDEAISLNAQVASIGLASEASSTALAQTGPLMLTLTFLVNFFKKYSSSLATPGDLLDASISAVAARLVPAIIPNANFLGGFGNPIPVPSGPDMSEVSALKAQVNTLQVQMRQVLEGRDSTAVIMGGRRFRSCEECIAFVEAVCPKRKGAGPFLDAVSLLQMVAHDPENATTAIQFQISAQKVGLSEVEAIVGSSFSLKLPTVFGSSAAASSTKVLSAIKDFVTWDPKSSYTGAKSAIEKGCIDQQTSFRDTIKETFSELEKPEVLTAQLVALEMLSESCSFVAALCAWISKFYEELVNGRSQAGPAETWELVGHIVRTIFKDIHAVRSPAQYSMNISSQAGAECGRYFWRTLQAHVVMKAFKDAHFQAHASISPIVTLHLYDHRAPTTMVQALEGRHDDLVKRVDKLAASSKK